MPKLCATEIRRLQAILRKPMPPHSMQRLVRYMDRRIGFRNLVQDTPFRDTYVAGNFAAARKAETVWLGADPPDFHLCGVSGCDTFETVETFPLGRKRSDEYRRIADAADKRETYGESSLTSEELALLAPEQDPDEGRWQARADTTSGLLAGAVAGKVSKGYPSDWGLVVLLDLGGFVPSDDSVVRHMQVGTAAAANAFAEVWVLWRGIAYPTWRQGTPTPATR